MHKENFEEIVRSSDGYYRDELSDGADILISANDLFYTLTNDKLTKDQLTLKNTIIELLGLGLGLT